VIEAFIFDLDGTLVDTEPLWCQAMQRFLSVRGLPVTEAYAHELVFGRAWSDIVARLRRDYPSILDEDGAIERESVGLYEALRGSMDIRIPNSIRLLKQLSRRHPVVIVSGSTRQQVEAAVVLMDVASHLRFYLGSEDYPRGKPDPSGFLLAAERLGVKPEACLVFEDSTAGVRAAKAAGMRCIALRPQGHTSQDLSAADEQLTDLAGFRWAAYGIAPD
jgi:HAD superfamily hydrolase (TIGR01509 family)